MQKPKRSEFTVMVERDEDGWYVGTVPGQGGARGHSCAVVRGYSTGEG